VALAAALGDAFFAGGFFLRARFGAAAFLAFVFVRFDFDAARSSGP
jgi:hypothetical protein